jgi:hypothetical protein
MSDCPLGCDWEFTGSMAPTITAPAGRPWPPYVWDSAAANLRVPSLAEEINAAAVLAAATATHVLVEHPESAAAAAASPWEFSRGA